MSHEVDFNDREKFTQGVVDGIRPHRRMTQEQADLAKRVAEETTLIVDPALLTGPNTTSIVDLERTVMARERRLQGWAAAARLHEKVEGVAVDRCAHCSGLASLFTDDPYFEIAWPCSTALALGLDQ